MATVKQATHVKLSMLLRLEATMALARRYMIENMF